MQPLLLAILVAPLTPSPFLPQQSQDDTAELIKQLGNELAETRDGASKKLRSVGVPALAALREAAKSKDPEVRARATALVKEITWDNRALYLAEQWGTKYFVFSGRGKRQGYWRSVTTLEGKGEDQRLVLEDTVISEDSTMEWSARCVVDPSLRPTKVGHKETGKRTEGRHWDLTIKGKQLVFESGDKRITRRLHHETLLSAGSEMRFVTLLPFENGFEVEVDFIGGIILKRPKLLKRLIKYCGQEPLTVLGKKVMVHRYESRRGSFAPHSFWVTDDRQLVCFGVGEKDDQGFAFELADEKTAKAWIKQHGDKR